MFISIILLIVLIILEFLAKYPPLNLKFIHAKNIIINVLKMYALPELEKAYHVFQTMSARILFQPARKDQEKAGGVKQMMIALLVLMMQSVLMFRNLLAMKKVCVSVI